MMSGLRGRLFSTLLAAPACCVAARTRVRTPAGEREAGSLAVGDAIGSVDLASGRLIAARVTRIRRATRECLALHHDGGVLICTPDHPLHAPDLGTYQPASRWTAAVAPPLLAWTDEGPRVVAVRTCEPYVGLHDVVDLTVDAAPHNFVAAGLVVHNKSFYEPGADAEGPSFELAVGGATRTFHVRACIDGVDPRDAGLSIFIETEVVQPPAGDGEMRLAGYVVAPGDEVPFVDTAVPGALTLRPGSRAEGGLAEACTTGVTVAFERIDGLADGVVRVTWTAGAHGTSPAGGIDDPFTIDIEG